MKLFDYLNHVVLNIEKLDFSNDRDFADDISYYTTDAARSSSKNGGSLCFYQKNSAPFNSLKKNKLENKEAIVYFSNSKKTMIELLRVWQEKSGEDTEIVSRSNLAIVCGYYADGKKKTLAGTLLKGKFATRAYNKETNSDAIYTMDNATRDVHIANMTTHFYYCYVGSPFYNNANLSVYKMINKSINAVSLATWLSVNKN